MASSRHFSGRPETAAEKKFFELRQSGYKGPIDQNGNKVTGGDNARVLRNMAAARGEDTSWYTG